MVKKLLVLLMLSIMVLLPLVSAELNFNIDEIKMSKIYLDEFAEFQVTIYNEDSNSNVFRLEAPVDWQLIASPAPGIIEGNSNKTIIVKLKPLTFMDMGKGYNVPVKLKSTNTNEDFSNLDFYVYVNSYYDHGRNYLPSIAFDIRYPRDIDPRSKAVSFEVFLRNRNTLNVSELKIDLQSTLFNKELVIPLGPLKEQTFDINFELDPQTAPITDNLQATLSYKNKTISQVDKNYMIKEYVSISDVERYLGNFIFKTKLINITNNGNSVETYSHKEYINSITSLYTSSDLDYQVIKDDTGRYHNWDVTLEPNESIVITLKQNFLLNYILLFSVIVALVLYFLLRSPLVLEKKAVVLNTNPEDGVSDIKVSLYIKNRTGSLVDDVMIQDFITNMADLVSETSIGTILPDKTIKQKNGTYLKWYLDSVDSYEERILTYKLKTKLKFIGKLKLGVAKTQFKSRFGDLKSVPAQKVKFVIKKY